MYGDTSEQTPPMRLDKASILKLVEVMSGAVSTGAGIDG
jgi:hypothetical protein